MRTSPYIEHERTDGRFRFGFLRGSFSQENYQTYARAALASGALVIRIFDGLHKFQWTAVDS
jgi:hypothetical protein